MKKAPKGTLKASKSNGTVQYYLVNEDTKKPKYISVDNKGLIKALAQKEYDKKFLKAAGEEKRKIRNIIDNVSKLDLQDVYSNINQNKRSLITSYVLSDEQFLEQWLNVEYKGKKISEDVPLIITERGERVRSKSEKIIADKLYNMGIPYRYEYPLKLTGVGVVYPDFTLLNMNTRKEIYMEHFGMMDDADYSIKAINRIEWYEMNGIYMGENLIVTFETSKQVLNMNVLENKLRDLLVL